MTSFSSLDHWCRSCGAPVERLDVACPACGVTLAGPDGVDGESYSRVGHVITIGRALFKRPAIVVAEGQTGVQLVGKGEETTFMPLMEFDAQPKLELPGAQVISAAGRLWRAAHATAAGAFKAGYSVEFLDRVAWEVGRRSLAAIRASILDRLALGAECDVSYLPVSSSEMSWYQAYTAALAGRTELMLEHLDGLPASGYDARCELLIARATDLIGDPSMTQRALAVLKGLVPHNRLAQCLVAALEPAGGQLPGELMAGYATIAAARIGEDPVDYIAVARALAEGRRLPALPRSPLVYARAMDAYLAGCENGDLNDSTEAIAFLPLECVDELIEIGALTRLPDDFMPWREDLTSYVKSRISPGSVDERTLEAAAFTAELGRRAYLRADRAGLAELSQSDAAVKHYVSLLDLRDDLAGSTVPPDLRPAVAYAVTTARAIAKEGTAGPTTVPAAVLGDPTLWPLLQKAAESGNLGPADPSHASAAEFVSWTDLCALQRKLFDGEWSEVIVDGNALASRTGYEAFADEALNMAAFAAMQLGRMDDAIKLIERALNGQFTTGLMINAAVLASSRGSVAAIPYLSRVFHSQEPASVRTAAIRQALQLWFDDAMVQDYPQPLAELVRSALHARIEDDLFHQLVKLSAYNDEDWLAGVSLAGGNQDQELMVEYFQAMARMHSVAFADNFVSFCEVVAKALKLRERPAWLEAEKKRIMDLLDKGLHVRYGEAPGFALGVQVLVRENVLDTFERIYLAPQSAAHLAWLIEDDNGELSEAVERTLVLDSIELFKQHRAHLTPFQQSYASEDVGRSTHIVLLHVWAAAARNKDAMADEYNDLNQRKRFDDVNRYNIIVFQRKLLLAFEQEYIARLRRLVNELGNLTLDDEQLSSVRRCRQEIEEWQAEIHRLRRNL